MYSQRSTAALIALVLSLTLFACGGNGPARELTIGAASSLKPLLDVVVSQFEEQTGIKPTAVGEHMFDDLSASVSNETVSRFIRDNESDFKDALNRINISCISWQDFSDALFAFSEKLKDGRGDRTLKRLISGLTTEIGRHPLSNVTGVN